ncbi:HIT domain-containing protein [Falsarthrobacter nasiphocae]|uniref:ATP adenylyltransferase n=1 Tax=Falsarthrobacter nasiphocae TaxID=189863 RepID=A0AAE3YIL6_9MICC|nr:HIT domain-containing protein [Falsarthrobacter nasiphocae]MDR6892947.1 ATP adenylyltransferase [Falsarthrobacter nasiphocae]
MDHENAQDTAQVTDDFELPGVPDAFQRLWTPHRMAYVKGGQKDHKEDECPFCAAPPRSDEESLIVARGEHCYVLLNLFPYNPGHLLVCPYRHIPMYSDLTDAELDEFSRLTQAGMRALKDASGCQGFNIGMNQGAVGGAGVAAHLHQHIVPRWGGDSNFLPIIAGTKALPQLLGEVRERVAAAWPASGAGTPAEHGTKPGQGTQAEGHGAPGADEPEDLKRSETGAREE